MILYQFSFVCEDFLVRGTVCLLSILSVSQDLGSSDCVSPRKFSTKRRLWGPIIWNQELNIHIWVYEHAILTWKQWRIWDFPQHSWGSGMSNWANWVGGWLTGWLGDYLLHFFSSSDLSVSGGTIDLKTETLHVRTEWGRLMPVGTVDNRYTSCRSRYGRRPSCCEDPNDEGTLFVEKGLGDLRWIPQNWTALLIWWPTLHTIWVRRRSPGPLTPESSLQANWVITFLA